MIRPDRDRQLKLAVAQLRQHFAGGQVVQGNPHFGKFLLKGPQGGRQNLDRQRGGITDMNFTLHAAGNCARLFHRVLGVLQDGLRLG